MSDLLPAGVFLVIALIATGRIVLLLSAWPGASSRLWPWLRLRRWWPVPADHAAETLLRQMLTPEEYDQLKLRAYLDIQSRAHLGRLYRVPRGPGQVQVLEGGRVVERLCVQPLDSLPEADVILMHKMLIEADEPSYLATANHFPRAVWR
ncbi:MAG: hypothetical protein ACRDHE_17930 [Ktedonobacterales bacterium]